MDRQGDGRHGSDILARYGILAEYTDISFAGQERQLRVLRTGSNLFLALFFGEYCCSGLFLFQETPEQDFGPYRLHESIEPRRL